MTPFCYSRVATIDDAIAAGAQSGTAFLAGGTELLNWLRLEIASPQAVIDVSRIPDLARIDVRPDGGMSIGAGVRLADIATHPVVAESYPVLAQAVLRSASPQLRNLATLGGNLLQATRCAYFRSEDAPSCNKRRAGSGCAARHGMNHRHAIFGWSDDCVATQPSDPAVALAVLDAGIVVAGPAGVRRISACTFHTLPAGAPERHNVLQPGELIVAVELAAPAPRSAYVKVGRRAAYDFGVVSAATTVDLEDGLFRSVRLALGSVAHRPWRLQRAEQQLRGLRPGSTAAAAAVVTAFEDAEPLARNAFKVPLARNAVLRALSLAAAQ